jgi:heptosyltransferase-2/heptosyltransferase-3
VKPGLPAPQSPRRILVCQLRQIGDVLLSTPAVELLARHYPQAEIHVFTEKKCLPALENNPFISAFLPLDKEVLPTVLHEYLFYHRAVTGKYDLLVDFQQLPRCRAVAALSGAATRISFPPPWYLRPLYTHWHQPAPAYAAAYKAGILEPLGIVWNGERPRLYPRAEERAEAGLLLSALGLEGKRFINVAASHRHAPRRWPARHYAALVDMLAEAEPDLFFFLTHGPGEEDYVRDLQSRCVHSRRVVTHEGPLDLRLIAACMERGRMQIGNCSAPRHMAVALDVPSLTILGASGFGWTFPAPEHIHVHAGQFMPMPCWSCGRNTCEAGLVCLEKLAPDLVFPIALKHLRTYGLSSGRARSGA